MADGPHKAEKESWENQLSFGLIRFKFLFDVLANGVDDESFFVNFETGWLIDERKSLEVILNQI